MRSAVALLGFLLASAQAFYIPVQQSRTNAVSGGNPKASFFGQTLARQAPASRATLVASLDDIEKKILAADEAKLALKRGAKAPAAKKAVSPASAPAAPAAPAKAVASKGKAAVGKQVK